MEKFSLEEEKEISQLRTEKKSQTVDEKINMKTLETLADVNHLFYFHLKNKLLHKKIILHDPAYIPKDYKQDAFEVIDIQFNGEKKEINLALQGENYTMELPATIDALSTVCVVEDGNNYRRLFPSFVEPKEQYQKKKESASHSGILVKLGKSKLAGRIIKTLATSALLSVGGGLTKVAQEKDSAQSGLSVGSEALAESDSEKMARMDTLSIEEFKELEEKASQLNLDSLKNEIVAYANETYLEDIPAIIIMEQEYAQFDKEEEKVTTELDSLQKALQMFGEKQKEIMAKFKEFQPSDDEKQSRKEEISTDSLREKNAQTDTAKGEVSASLLKTIELASKMAEFALNSDLMKTLLSNQASSLLTETAIKALSLIQETGMSQADLQATIETFIKRNPDTANLINKMPEEFMRQLIESPEFKNLENNAMMEKIEGAIDGILAKKKEIGEKKITILRSIEKKETDEHILEKRLQNLTESSEKISEMTKKVSFEDAAKIYSLWADQVGEEYLDLYKKPNKEGAYTMSGLLLFQSMATKWLENSPVAKKLKQKVSENEIVKKNNITDYIKEPFVLPDAQSKYAWPSPYAALRDVYMSYIRGYGLNQKVGEIFLWEKKYKAGDINNQEAWLDKSTENNGAWAKFTPRDLKNIMHFNIPFDGNFTRDTYSQYDFWGYGSYNNEGILYFELKRKMRNEPTTYYQSVFGNIVSPSTNDDSQFSYLSDEETYALCKNSNLLKKDIPVFNWDEADKTNREIQKYGKCVIKIANDDISLLESPKENDPKGYSYHYTDIISLNENLFANQSLTEALFDYSQLPKFKKAYGAEKFVERILSAKLSSAQEEYIFEFTQILSSEEKKKLKEIIEEKGLYAKNALTYKLWMDNATLEDVEQLKDEITEKEKAKLKSVMAWNKNAIDFYTRNAIHTYDKNKHSSDFFDYLERYLMATHDLYEAIRGPKSDI